MESTRIEVGGFPSWQKTSMNDFIVGFFGAPGFLSHHTPCTFTMSDDTGAAVTYTSGEQRMMHCKAMMFEDTEIAARILATNDSVAQKRLGRQVDNFDAAEWRVRCEGIVEELNLAKFTQNPRYVRALLSTGDRYIAECDHRDKIWAVGRSLSSVMAQPSLAAAKEHFNGENLLGKCLMRVREELRRREANEGSE